MSASITATAASTSNDIVIKMKLPRCGSEIAVTDSSASSRTRRWNVWEWNEVIRIPAEDLKERRFCKKPYKWLRFISGLFLDAEGDLRIDANPESQKVDYNSDTAAAPAVLYYHIYAAEQMFPFDVKFLNGKATSTAVTPRAQGFKDQLWKRDGEACVATGYPYIHDCDGVHLVARNKGSAYIKALTENRRLHRVQTNAVIDDIDDVRNGLSLMASMHRAFGHRFAILRTPNFAMTTEDVIIAEEENQPRPGPNTVRYTATFFCPKEEVETGFSICTGVEVRQPKSKQAWPPPVLFDYVYIAAVVEHYGVKGPGGNAPPHWKGQVSEYEVDYYGPGGAMARQLVEDRDKATDLYNRGVTRTAPGQASGIFEREHDNFDRVDLLRLSALEPGEFTKLLKSLAEEADEEARIEAEKASKESKGKVEAWISRLT